MARTIIRKLHVALWPKRLDTPIIGGAVFNTSYFINSTSLSDITPTWASAGGGQEGHLPPPPEKPKKLKNTHEKIQVKKLHKKLKNTDEFTTKRIK